MKINRSKRTTFRRFLVQQEDEELFRWKYRKRHCDFSQTSLLQGDTDYKLNAGVEQLGELRLWVLSVENLK